MYHTRVTIVEYHDMCEELLACQNKLLRDKELLLKLYMLKEGKSDYRMHAVDYIGSSITKMRLALILRVDPLMNANWWKKHGWTTTSEEALKLESDEVVMVTINSIYVAAFSCHESYLRAIYRKLNPKSKSFYKSLSHIIKFMNANSIVNDTKLSFYELHSTM